MEESSWSQVFDKLDKETFDKLQSALDSLKEVAPAQEEEKIADDPSKAIKQLNAKLTKMMKQLKAHRGRFTRIENRVSSIERSGVSRGGGDDYAAAIGIDNNIDIGVKPIKKRKKQRKLKTMAKSQDIADDSQKDRKHFYHFGTRNLQVLKPSTGYPTKKEAQRPVEGKLELFYSHGYSGNFDESRQNICLSSDGTKLIYYIAAIAVVYDYQNNSQQFFTKHNDDLTTICLSPKKTWAASGQKDPKDEPGKGKDLV